MPVAHIVFDMVENVAIRTETLSPILRKPNADPDLGSLTTLPSQFYAW